MLGEIYHPTGKALETAQQVLEVKEPMACNMAYGCTNSCSYCYIPYTEKGKMRLPKTPPLISMRNQLREGLKPEGVFLSFMTDPFNVKICGETDDVLDLLRMKKIKAATLSKLGYSIEPGVRSGMTIVSDNEEFRKKYEPEAIPIKFRIDSLKRLKESGNYVWVSVEPFPPPEIYNQDLMELLNKIDFVDFIIFGKWNYDKRANDKDFYRKAVHQFNAFCEEKGIRHYVKSDTMKFIEG